MGRGYHHFNAIHKETLGWLTVPEVTESGVYAIGPFERVETPVKALKIVPESGEPFYLEYRRPIGFDRLSPDSLSSAGWYKGPLIHVGQGPSSALLAMDVTSRLLPGSPDSPSVIGSLERPALLPGMQYHCCPN